MGVRVAFKSSSCCGNSVFCSLFFDFVRGESWKDSFFFFFSCLISVMKREWNVWFVHFHWLIDALYSTLESDSFNFSSFFNFILLVTSNCIKDTRDKCKIRSRWKQRTSTNPEQRYKRNIYHARSRPFRYNMLEFCLHKNRYITWISFEKKKMKLPRTNHTWF